MKLSDLRQAIKEERYPLPGWYPMLFDPSWTPGDVRLPWEGGPFYTPNYPYSPNPNDKRWWWDPWNPPDNVPINPGAPWNPGVGPGAVEQRWFFMDPPGQYVPYWVEPIGDIPPDGIPEVVFPPGFDPNNPDTWHTHPDHPGFGNPPGGNPPGGPIRPIDGDGPRPGGRPSPPRPGTVPNDLPPIRHLDDVPGGVIDDIWKGIRRFLSSAEGPGGIPASGGGQPPMGAG